MRRLVTFLRHGSDTTVTPVGSRSPRLERAGVPQILDPASHRRRSVKLLSLLLVAALLLGPTALAQVEAPIDVWFPRLREGMWVEVKGALDPKGQLLASRLRVLDGERDEWEIETHVAAVDSLHMLITTALGNRVVVTAKTALRGPGNAGGVPFAFLVVGDVVEVEGKPQKDGSMLADELKVEKSKRRKPDLQPKNEHELKARIESITADKRQIVLMGLIVQLDENTRHNSAGD